MAVRAPEGQPAFEEQHEDVGVDAQQWKEASFGGQEDEVEYLFVVFDFHCGDGEGWDMENAVPGRGGVYDVGGRERDHGRCWTGVRTRCSGWTDPAEPLHHLK